MYAYNCILDMQFSINYAINIHVLTHYCCIFRVKCYNVVAIRLTCFLGLHGSHTDKLTSSSSSSSSNATRFLESTRIVELAVLLSRNNYSPDTFSFHRPANRPRNGTRAV